MPPKHSKSEIETALSGEHSHNRRKQSNQANMDELHFTTPTTRKQKVLGGNLTGVSRSKQGRPGIKKLLGINTVNWLAGSIVLLILIAFFWPHENQESTREVLEREQNITPKPFYSESVISEPEQAIKSEQSFSKPNDIDRADVYREQEQLDMKIRSILETAKNHLSKQQYTRPPGGNALSAYRQVLALDTTNNTARDGILHIKDIFFQAGLRGLATSNESLAKQSLSKLELIDKQSDEYSELEQAYQQWNINTQITKLLAQANNASSKNNVILPARDNALYYYQQILEIDEQNQAAASGISDIANSYIKQANQAFIQGEYEAATGYLATVSVIEPQHPSIGLLSEMIAKAKPIAAQTNTQQETTQIPAQQSTNTQISDAKTPSDQTSEQQTFDLQYLERGLDAYYKGEYENAALLLQPLADKGVARAQFRIGYMHYLGRGFEVDRQEADRIIRAALPAIRQFANEGRSWAQSDYGSLYEDGLVLPRDYDEAIYWYRKAAEQGYSGAQTNLGIMYARGRGVSQNRQTAIEWFQRAAKQGDIAAIRNLQSLGIN